MAEAIEILPEDASSLKEIVMDLANKNHHLESKIETLQAQLLLLQKQRFQSRSEKYPNHPDLFEGELFNEIECLQDQPEEEPKVDVPAHSRKVRKSRGLSADLPRVDVVHDLPESEKRCACGQALRLIGQEQGVEQLAIIPARHYVIRHLKNKYACACGDCIQRAKMPAQPIPKSQASPILLAYLMVAKFLDGLPLYRLEKIVARDGLLVSRKKMANWLVLASAWFDRLYDCFERQLNSYDIASGDETHLQVLKEPGRSATSKSWLWLRRGGPPDKPVVLVNYNPSRGKEVPCELFSGYRNGYLVVDAYASYNKIAEDNGLTIVGCHDHARRKFFEAYESLSFKQKQTKGGIARQAIQRYKALYRIEHELKGKSPEEIKATRQKRSLPLLKDFKAWLEKIQKNAIMSEKTEKAVTYFLNQYPALTVYCNDGRLPIANIQTEHVAKIIAVARKNFLFANTPSGARTSAKIYSMILTAVANGLEPTRYLTYLLTELPKLRGDASVEHLLPWVVTPEILNEHYDQIPKP